MTDQVDYWKAVQNRDSSFDGSFFYGVHSTKVYCRPGCPSRTPLRHNVRFYPSPVEAEADGLRPCKRCKPLELPALAMGEKMRQVRIYIRQNLDSREKLKLTSLAKRFEMSPFHFQRTFHALTGVSPRQFAEGLRIELLKEDLRASKNITDAIYDAGFGSSSRVYEHAAARLGMTPSQYRSGGNRIEISYATSQTPLGLVMLGATSQGLCFIEFGDSENELVDALRREFPAAVLLPMPDPQPVEFLDWMRRFHSFLQGEQAAVEIPLALHGTAFQLKVWRYLTTIPAGSVQSYAQVASGIGKPKAVRAVASACAANKLAVAIPCHRVIRGDGGLGGYRWGIEKKRALIDMERRSVFSH